MSFFNRVKTSVKNIFFSNNELHIILNRRYLENCEHSPFFLIIDENDMKFAEQKNHSGQILYRSPC